MGSRDGSSCELLVQQDGQPLSKRTAGNDIVRLQAKKTSVSIDLPRMYQLVRNPEFGSHLLKLTTSNCNLEIYSITFTTCVIPELISAN
jgi:hypothetical protein